MIKEKQVIFSKYFSYIGSVEDFSIRYSSAKGVELFIKMLVNTELDSFGEDALIICDKPYAEYVYSSIEMNDKIAVGGLINIYKYNDVIIPKTEGYAFTVLESNKENNIENGIIGDKNYLELPLTNKKEGDDNVIRGKETKRGTGLKTTFRNCFRGSF